MVVVGPLFALPRDMKNIAFTVTVPEERLVDYIERADISYWGAVVAWNPEILNMTISDDEADGKLVMIERRHWELALQIATEKFGNVFADLMSDSGDMYTGDILIQLACFGEEKYA